LERELEAINVFERIAQELQFAFTLQSGEALMINNHTRLHAHSQFEDGPEPHQRRLLIRLRLGCQENAAVAPQHLAFERSYGPGFDPASYIGLLKPYPAKFHVPLSSRSDGL
jgi:hypothetical protein